MTISKLLYHKGRNLQEKKRSVKNTSLFIIILFFESVLESNGAVEYKVFGGRIAAVGTEITHAQELEAVSDLCVTEHILNLCTTEHFERGVVHALNIILTFTVGIFIGKKVGIKANFCLGAIIRVNPMNGSALDLASVSGITAAGFGIIGAENLGNISIFILDTAGALDEVSTFQTALGTIGIEALIFGNGNFEEVFAFDIAIAGET